MTPAVAHTERHPSAASPADPVAAAGVSALVRGVLLIRWAVLAWMLVLAGIGVVDGRDPIAAIGAVAVVTAWVGWLTLARPAWTQRTLLADLLVAAGLVVAGARFGWLATIYPVTAALTWGAAKGVSGGMVAGGVLGFVSVAAGGLLSQVEGVQSLQVLRDPVYFLLAGGGVGFVAKLLEDSAAQVRAAQDEQVRATERAARATERESLGRQIHDSVLQTLALVHKRGRELAGQDHVAGTEVAALADLAAAQERTLRSMILRPPDDAIADGHSLSVRDRLERAADTVAADLATSVSAVGEIRLPAHQVDEIGAAVEQALGNVVQHAAASHAWVFADVEHDELVVSVRDDGCGFTFDEDALRAAGKFGLLRSIRGRVEDLGGALAIRTAAGRGTELELRIPVPDTVGQEDEAGE